MNEEGVRYQGRARKRGRHGTQKSNMDDLLLKCVRIKSGRRAHAFYSRQKHCCTLLQRKKKKTNYFNQWLIITVKSFMNEASIVRHHSRLGARHVA